MKEKLKKLKKLADAMYYAAQHLTTDASRLHKAMDEYHQFIINEYHKEETVSDLEEAATSFARKDSEGISNPANFYYTVADKARIFKAGTKWQKEQFEKNRLKHCDNITNEQAELEQGFIDQHLDKYQRMPTFLDAIEYGMRLQNEQMMAKAFDGEILDIEDNDCAMCSHTHLELFVEPDTLEKNCFKNNDKVKVVVIKED